MLTRAELLGQALKKGDLHGAQFQYDRLLRGLVKLNESIPIPESSVLCIEDYSGPDVEVDCAK